MKNEEEEASPHHLGSGLTIDAYQHSTKINKCYHTNTSTHIRREHGRAAHFA